MRRPEDGIFPHGVGPGVAALAGGVMVAGGVAAWAMTAFFRFELCTELRSTVLVGDSIGTVYCTLNVKWNIQL